MSLEQRTPTKAKCTCDCFYPSVPASDQPSCPKCHQ